jgi:hypothetical protein
MTKRLALEEGVLANEQRRIGGYGLKIAEEWNRA